MNRRMLSGALGALLLAGVCVQASVLAGSTAPMATVASVRPGDASVYKFAEGGIQFTVPAGWDIKADKDSVKVSPKGGNAQIAFVALPIATDLNSDERESLFDSLSGKAGITDMKVGDYMDYEKLGDMRVAARRYEGKNNGRDVEGMFLLLSAEKFVFIVLVASKSDADTHKELGTVIDSVKKIE